MSATDASESYTSDSSNDYIDLDDEFGSSYEDMFWAIAHCMSEEAWARAQNSGIMLTSMGTLLAAGAGLFEESE